MRHISIKLGEKRINFDIVILLLILSIPFINLWYFNVYRSKLNAICIIFVMLIIFKCFAQIEVFKKPKIVFVLLTYLAISMLFFNFPTSIEYFIVILFGAFIMSVKYSDRLLKQMMEIFIIIGLFFAITLIWQRFSPGTFYPVLRIFVSESQYRQAIEYTQVGDYTGFACESHAACLCMAPAACILFAQLFFKETRKKHIISNVLLFCLLFYAMSLAGRRVYILFFPAIIICFSIYFLLKKRSSIAKLFGIILIIIVLVTLYFAFLGQIIDLLTGGTGEGIQLSNREVYWQLAINMFKERPLTGMGMRSYDFQYNLMSGRNLTFAGAHNCYLQMLAEIGIIGTMLFFGMVFFMLFKTAKLTVFCIRKQYEIIGSYAMMSLFMQCIFVCVAMSEAIFFAPYSAILYFIILSISENITYRQKGMVPNYVRR